MIRPYSGLWQGPGVESYIGKEAYNPTEPPKAAQWPTLEWWDDYGATVTSECGTHGLIFVEGYCVKAEFLDSTARFADWKYIGPSIYDAFTWIMFRFEHRDF
jgi:hypothetical protein